MNLNLLHCDTFLLVFLFPFFFLFRFPLQLFITYLYLVWKYSDFCYKLWHILGSNLGLVTDSLVALGKSAPFVLQ